MHVDIRGQLLELIFILKAHGFLEDNSDLQAYQQVPSPPEPSCSLQVKDF